MIFLDNEMELNERLTKLLRICGKKLHHGVGGKCSQERILMIVEQKGKITQRGLMDIIGIQSGSMSEIIAKVEERGFICRVKNQNDKRNLDIMLTEKGKAEAKRVRLHREEVQRKLYAPLSDEEKEQLIVLLNKLATVWDYDYKRGKRDEQI